MNDIYLGLAIMTGISTFLFFVALKLCKSIPQPLADVVSISTVLATIFYAFRVWDQIFLARLLPFSNLIVLGNWFPLAAGFLAGSAWNRVPGGVWRKGFSVLALALVAGYAAMQPLLGDPPTCNNRWNGKVCLQTTEMTCSPASAATLLREFGIDVTEQQMADLCFTRRGTTWQGLYHGLAVMVADRPLQVEVRQVSLDELRALPGPLLLSVVLKYQDSINHPKYEARLGWTADVPHTVVYYGHQKDGSVLIADPSFGFERWTDDDLEILWHGRIMSLVPR